MPPLLVQLMIRHRAVHLRLWLPLFLFWLLLLPLVLILLPIAVVVMARADRHPVRTITALLGVLSAISGSMIDIERPNAALFVRFV